MLRDPQVYFGDAYSGGKIEVGGDLVKFMVMLFQIFSSPEPRSLANRIAGWLHVPRRNTLTGSRDNIHRHYALGNDFYSLWLGETMAYTCAYYPTMQTSLEEAQTAKMDHVCRKLRLNAADTVIEAGCVWGSLALHMAKRYGAKVRVFNISKEQLEFARRRARKQELNERVEFIEDDYRNISALVRRSSRSACSSTSLSQFPAAVTAILEAASRMRRSVDTLCARDVEPADGVTSH